MSDPPSRLPNRVRRARRLAALVVAAGLVASLGPSGCRLVEYAGAATRSTSYFRASRADSRVAYEPGAEQMAEVVASAMPSAVESVEQGQYGPFTAPIHVYVCAMLDTFAKYTAAPRAGGHTINRRIFISPKPENTVARVPHVLVHELSHLHLGQRRSDLRVGRLPTWFSEGLAVLVSGGAGAEGVTEQDARRAISEGHTFAPETEGSLLHPQGASAYGLDEHLFYAQAGMFVGYLRALDEGRFRAFLRAVEEGDALGPAFEAAYGASIEATWRRFVDDAKARTATSRPAPSDQPKTLR